MHLLTAAARHYNWRPDLLTYLLEKYRVDCQLNLVSLSDQRLFLETFYLLLYYVDVFFDFIVLFLCIAPL